MTLSVSVLMLGCHFNELNQVRLCRWKPLSANGCASQAAGGAACSCAEVRAPADSVDGALGSLEAKLAAAAVPPEPVLQAVQSLECQVAHLSSRPGARKVRSSSGQFDEMITTWNLNMLCWNQR